MQRWNAPFEPKRSCQVEAFAKQARMPLMRRAIFSCAALGLLGAGIIIIFSAGLGWWWALLACESMLVLMALEFYGQEASEARVWRQATKSFGDKPRAGKPSCYPYAKLQPSAKQGPGSAAAAGVGIWRVRKGLWSQVGWEHQPKWFESLEKAEAFAGRIDFSDDD